MSSKPLKVSFQLLHLLELGGLHKPLEDLLLQMSYDVIILDFMANI
jgi:hypothetical protein